MAAPRNPANVPAHIDARLVPRGLYWDPRGRWLMRVTDPDGKRRKLVVAGRDASLAELHALAAASAAPDGPAHGTVAAVCAAFHASVAFAGLAPRTRHDYERLARIIAARKAQGHPGGFGTVRVDALSRPRIQALVENIAKEGHPTKANQVLRYLRRTFKWGVNHGACTTNPAHGCEAVREAKHVVVPDLPTYARWLDFARSRAALTAHTPGACAPYLPHVAEVAYLCRLRGIEVITLTDAHLTAAGLVTNRRKGSRDTLVAWTPRLRAAVDALLGLRAAAWARHHRPTPLHPAQRPLVVPEAGGDALTKSALDSAWQRLMRQAVAAGVLAKAERFGLHAMKHRGITDTAGTFADKQVAAGHKSPAMTQRYDHSLPTVGTPEPPPAPAPFTTRKPAP